MLNSIHKKSLSQPGALEVDLVSWSVTSLFTIRVDNEVCRSV